MVWLTVPPSPPLFGSADSKEFTARLRVSVDSAGFEVLCFECALCKLVSVHSSKLKVICFDTDSSSRVSADSKRVR